jgi:hypothetical protein
MTQSSCSLLRSAINTEKEMPVNRNAIRIPALPFATCPTFAVNLFSDLAELKTARHPNETSRMPDREASRTGEKVPPLVGMDASQMSAATPSIQDSSAKNRKFFCMTAFYFTRALACKTWSPFVD